MKLLVFGTSEFAVPTLEALAARHDVVGVVTQPDRAAGRGHKLVATPVKRAASERGLRVVTPEKLKPFVDDARALGADAFVVASYGKIVPQALLDVVPIAFNVHPSLLPLYRGATPIQSVIRDGRTETGVTIIAMDAGMDTGDVLLQERTPIGPEETYGQLHDRLAVLGAELVTDALARYANGSLERTSQSEIAAPLGIGDEEVARTLTRPLSKADHVLPKSATTRELVDFIRSRAPSPGARVVEIDAIGFPDGNIGTGSVRIVKAHVLREPPVVASYDRTVESGRLLLNGGFWFIRALDGWIAVDELIPEGARKMSMAAWANGHPLRSAQVDPSAFRPLSEVLRA